MYLLGSSYLLCVCSYAKAHQLYETHIYYAKIGLDFLIVWESTFYGSKIIFFFEYDYLLAVMTKANVTLF